MEEKKIENPGAQIVRWLKPGGCILVLVLTAVAMFLMFTSGSNPIKGYEPPQSSEYYARHLDELQTELETNVFPKLSGIGACEVRDGRLAVTLTGADYAVPRSAILQYYDRALFEFIIPTQPQQKEK
ncbi:MAG: hypothetical protein RR055_02205 [Oscillospiraceae bacterium]